MNRYFIRNSEWKIKRPNKQWNYKQLTWLGDKKIVLCVLLAVTDYSSLSHLKIIVLHIVVSQQIKYN